MTIYVGKQITDFYCNGYFGRRYDLSGSIITDEWQNLEGTEKFIEITTTDGEILEASFSEHKSMDELINSWVEQGYLDLIESAKNWNLYKQRSNVNE